MIKKTKTSKSKKSTPHTDVAKAIKWLKTGTLPTEKKQWSISGVKVNTIKNLKPWKKWQSGNPVGRKPKTFLGIAKQLQKEWYTQVTKEMIREAYQILLGVDREKLLKMVNDEKQPMTIRIVAKRMLSGEGHEQIESMLDRVHGKAAQTIDGKQEVNLTLASGLIALRRVEQKKEE